MENMEFVIYFKCMVSSFIGDRGGCIEQDMYCQHLKFLGWGRDCVKEGWGDCNVSCKVMCNDSFGRLYFNLQTIKLFSSPAHPLLACLNGLNKTILIWTNTRSNTRFPIDVTWLLIIRSAVSKRTATKKYERPILSQKVSY